jgi:hypothetical protein
LSIRSDATLTHEAAVGNGGAGMSSTGGRTAKARYNGATLGSSVVYCSPTFKRQGGNVYMRKLFLGAVVALSALLGVAGVASAIDGTQTVDVKLTHSKAGTKEKPKSVGTLKVTTTTTPGPVNPAGSFAVTNAVISFDKNLVFNASAFKVCSTSDLTTIDTKCKGLAKGQVGKGSALGSALGQNEALDVKAYNGPKSGSGYKFYLHVSGSQPLAIDTVIVAKLAKATGKYGWKLTVPIPQELQRPSNVLATLTSFITSVSGTSKGKPYVGIKGCTGGKLNFRGVFSYTDGTNKTATSTSKCSK